MQGQKRERWMELAELVAAEQDPTKFDALVAELNRLLSEKDRRLHPVSRTVSSTPGTDGASETPKAQSPESKKS